MPLAELDDAKIHFTTRGSGFPVLGVMGFGLDQRFWAGQIPTVTAHHTFITFDNRGTGKSTGTPVATIDEMASDALALLDYLEVERAVVLGASMGGAIAQRMALDHPDRIAALVLAVTWARPIEFMRRQSELARIILEASGPDAFVDAGVIHMFTPRFFEIGRDAIEQMLMVLSSDGSPGVPSLEVVQAQLKAIDQHSVLAELHAIRCPTLVVGGKLDMIVPLFAAEEIAAAIPGAELAVFESGHALMVEEMDEFNRRLGAFLEGLILGNRAYPGPFL
jgi:pimeloyl-ACP methyl ester carboxylesterase